MSQAQALAAAQSLAAHLQRRGIRVSIELQPGVAGSGWYSSTTRVAEMSHHTVSRRSQGNTPVLALVKRGRPDVPGPLCNGYMGFDEVYRIITVGWANHPGAGGPLTVAGRTIPKNNARPYVWGTEYEGGLVVADFTPSYRSAMARANAAILEWLGRPVEAHIEHATWAPGRKVDRLGYTAAAGQAEIRAAQLATLPPHVKEPVMAGPVRLNLNGAIHFVDVATGTFVHIPNPEYNTALGEGLGGRLVEVNQRQFDVIGDFCARVRAQHAAFNSTDRSKVDQVYEWTKGMHPNVQTRLPLVHTAVEAIGAAVAKLDELDVEPVVAALVPAVVDALASRSGITVEQVRAAAEQAVRTVLRDGVDATA